MNSIPRRKIEQFFELNPTYKARGKALKTIAALVGITEEQAYQANCLRRELQRMLPPDEKGMELEKEWRALHGMASMVELLKQDGNVHPQFQKLF